MRGNEQRTRCNNEFKSQIFQSISTLISECHPAYFCVSLQTGAITTSSFCAVHEISKPFYLFKDSHGNPTWKPSVVNAGAKAHGAKRK